VAKIGLIIVQTKQKEGVFDAQCKEEKV